MSAPAVVLMSVRSPHIDRLLDGSKTIELRRRQWRVPAGSIALLYASGSRRALVGSLKIAGVDAGTPNEIWNRYSEQAAVSRRDFDDYFLGAGKAVAIRVGSPRCLDFPVSLVELRRRWPVFIVPQSFRYVPRKELSKILNGERRILLQ